MDETTRRGFLAKVGLGALALVGVSKMAEAKPAPLLTGNVEQDHQAMVGRAVAAIKEIRATRPSAMTFGPDDDRRNARIMAQINGWYRTAEGLAAIEAKEAEEARTVAR